MEIEKETVSVSFSLLYINSTPGFDRSAVLMKESPQRSFKGYQKATGSLFVWGICPWDSVKECEVKPGVRGQSAPMSFYIEVRPGGDMGQVRTCL